MAFLVEDWSHMRKLPGLFDLEAKGRIQNFQKVLTDYKKNKMDQLSKKNQDAFMNILKPKINYMVEFAQGKHPGKAEDVLVELKKYYDALE